MGFSGEFAFLRAFGALCSPAILGRTRLPLWCKPGRTVHTNAIGLVGGAFGEPFVLGHATVQGSGAVSGPGRAAD
jgi:hypothetical protein